MARAKLPVSHLEEIWGHRFGELSDYKTTVTLNLAKIRNTYALLIIFWGHFFGRPKRLTALIFRLDSTLIRKELRISLILITSSDDFDVLLSGNSV